MEEFKIHRRFEYWKEQDKPIIGKLKGLFDKTEQIPMKERVFRASYLLDLTSKKLKSLSQGLNKRTRLFFEKCIEAEITGDHMRAILYANECAELRKLAKLVLSSELALEQAALRLQTISKLGDVFTSLVPIMTIVEETKGQLVGVIPSVAGKLREVNYMLKSISETGSVTVPSGPLISTGSSEANKILEEAYLSAEEKLRARFPQLPVVEGTRIPVTLTAAGGSVAIVPKDSFKEPNEGKSTSR